MSQQCSWQTRSRPLEGLCLYYALLGLSQAPGFAGGHDFFSNRRLYGILDERNIRWGAPRQQGRSEEHTSELQSRFDLVCRLLLEKKKKIYDLGRITHVTDNTT